MENVLKARIAELEEKLHEAERGPWPEWAQKVLAVIRRHTGNEDLDDDGEGVDLPAELDELLVELARPHKVGEMTDLRGLAATCYAGLGAEHNLPETWLDVLNAAANGDDFTTAGLLPYTPNVDHLCARIRAADDAAMAEADYMLDSDDCIKVLRGEWTGPPKPNPDWKPDPARAAAVASALIAARPVPVGWISTWAGCPQQFYSPGPERPSYLGNPPEFQQPVYFKP